MLTWWGTPASTQSASAFTALDPTFVCMHTGGTDFWGYTLALSVLKRRLNPLMSVFKGSHVSGYVFLNSSED